MIKTLIIEDEEPASQRLEKLLRSIEPGIEIIDVLDSVINAINWFKTNRHPDLVMLDIQLADGQSFEIFKAVEIKSFVIFTTAYDEFAIKAFELNSIDYLLKPIDKEKLSLAIKKYKELKNPDQSFNLNELIAKLEGNASIFKKRFVVNLGRKIKSIEAEKIACFFSIEKNTFLVLYSGNSYPVDFSLDKLETMLDPDNFFRINRQYLINYRAIEKMNVLSKSRIEVFISSQENGILASTGKTHSFRLWLDR